MYDIGSGEETLLTDFSYDQTLPRITGDLVVFEDCRYTRTKSMRCFRHLTIMDVITGNTRRITTNPLFWVTGARHLINGKLVAAQKSQVPRGYELWLFDLVEMGILDHTGQNVIPD